MSNSWMFLEISLRNAQLLQLQCGPGGHFQAFVRWRTVFMDLLSPCHYQVRMWTAYCFLYRKKNFLRLCSHCVCGTHLAYMLGKNPVTYCLNICQKETLLVYVIAHCSLWTCLAYTLNVRHKCGMKET